jgi:PAT family beta-lactamase induction signal transducer AmpG
MSTPFALYLFGILYFVQGAALAYVGNFQKPYLSESGVSPRAIGLLTTVLLLPFVLKVFLGLLTDRVRFGRAKSRRKPYLLMGLLLSAGAFALCAIFTPADDFWIFAGLIVLASFGVALFDATTDGLAVEVTREADQGLVQSAMVGGKATGLILLSLLFGWISSRFGYRPVFLSIAVALLLPIPAVLRLEENERSLATKPKFRWRDLWSTLTPAYLAFAAYAIFYSIVAFGVDGLVTFSLSRRFQVPRDFIGHYGALRGIGSVAGAIVAGFALRGTRRFGVGMLALAVLTVGAFGASWIGQPELFLPFGFVWGFAWAFQETAYVTFAMGVADTNLAATSFSLLMAFSNLGTAVVEGIATPLAAERGFPPVFFGLGCLMGVVVPLFILSQYLRRRGT